ncbi:MAG: hypothetical protein ABI411_19175 [Tahibacter sp.]
MATTTTNRQIARRATGFLCAAILLMGCALSHAATYVVGSGTGCTHSTLQSAIAAAQGTFGADTIRVTRSASYTQQALVVSSADSLDVLGGYASCTDVDSDGLYTTIDGAGGSTEPVFRITANTGGSVRLRYLTIRGGDEDGGGYGGGIYFRGDGTLEIDDSTISQNTAGYGGGIYAQGTGANAKLLLGGNVQIVSNTARYSGGGVYDEGLDVRMTAPGSWIAFNHAPGVFNGATGQYDGGYAGGLMVLSDNLPASASVGSSAIGDAGPIYFNDARYGGGVAVISHEAPAELRLFTVDPAKPVRIRSNSASVAGGGIYQKSADLFRYTYVKLWYAFLEDNIAPSGAAVYVTDGEWVSTFLVNEERPPGAVDCPLDQACGGIIGNAAENESAQPIGGVVQIDGGADPRIRQIEFSGNRGRNLLRSTGEECGTLALKQILFVDNVVSEHLIGVDDNAWDAANCALQMDDTTIAGNVVGAGSLLRIASGSASWLRRSILWQPGKTTLTARGSPLQYATLIASEVASLNAGPEAIVTDPRFVDPARSDYRPRAGSPAIDAATVDAAETRDVYGRTREVDIGIVENSRGSRDIGAIERQSVLPLVLNSDLNVDSNLWLDSSGISSWDATLNASGTTGSGSIKVSQSTTAPSISGASQCVHVPGAGAYALNGWGRTAATPSPTRDAAYLVWEYRRFGGEGCTDGAPDQTGQLFLSMSGWRRPAVPAVIAVPQNEWTYTSSITIRFVVFENGITSPPLTNGWFDGVTLEPVLGDGIFADGFD